MSFRTAVTVSALLAVASCGGKRRQQKTGADAVGQTEVTPLKCPAQRIDGDIVRLTGFRTTREWEQARTPSGGRLFPQDAEEGSEFFVVRAEIDTQGKFKDLRFGAENVSALASDGSRYSLAQPPGTYIVLVADQESGTVLKTELPIELPVGTDVCRIEIRGVPFDVGVR